MGAESIGKRIRAWLKGVNDEGLAQLRRARSPRKGEPLAKAKPLIGRRCSRTLNTGENQRRPASMFGFLTRCENAPCSLICTKPPGVSVLCLAIPSVIRGSQSRSWIAWWKVHGTGRCGRFWHSCVRKPARIWETIQGPGKQI
jgi:hypothetical protein